jgi:8-oxo-dGTP pyrophosphatase MutT (NUDIX family)
MHCGVPWRVGLGTARLPARTRRAQWPAKRYAVGMSVENVRSVFRGRVITVNVETVRLPNGHVAELEIIHHPGGAAIVAIDAVGRVCLIRQFRHAAGGWVWELPAGKLEPREPPLETARRELREEAGSSAQNWQSLGVYVSSPGVFTEIVHLYLARQLDSVKMAHEAAELIEVHWVQLEDACTRALHGDINDGKTALGLLRARSVLESVRAGPP